jgi:hypothetical protein
MKTNLDLIFANALLQLSDENLTNLTRSFAAGVQRTFPAIRMKMEMDPFMWSCLKSLSITRKGTEAVRGHQDYQKVKNDKEKLVKLQAKCIKEEA